LNEYRESEVATLKESLKKERDPDERERIETALRHLVSAETLLRVSDLIE